MSHGNRVADALLLATVFVITFAKIRFATAAGDVYLSDVTASLFLLAAAGSRVARRDWRLARAAGAAALFFVLFLLVYLLGFYNVETAADWSLYVKGLAKFAIHFAFVVAAVAYLARRSVALYWRALAWFVAGFAANAAYGLLQLGLAETTGRNLDELVLGRLGLYQRGGIAVQGVVGEHPVYRTNALTLDANHLGVMLVVPILVLLPIYLRLERGHRARAPLALLLAFLTLVELTTLSRSGILGITVGLLVLGVPYRHLLRQPRFLVPLGALSLVVLSVVLARFDFFRTVFASRTQTSGPGTELHFEFYSLIGPALADHPLFGLGLNTFSTYYEGLTGKTNWGPHSYYISVLTETGTVGALAFVAYVAFLFSRLGRLQRLGRRLAAAGNRLSARVRPLAWGLLAALLGTMAANAFYLTMQMYYFFAFAVFVVVAPSVFAGSASATPEP
ncbi:MAG: O-antigen ligase family protein [Thermoleophilia bacterium]|nr:O-antigen ligase family protein [Thermoleophilia bacterium]